MSVQKLLQKDKFIISDMLLSFFFFLQGYLGEEACLDQTTESALLWRPFLNRRVWPHFEKCNCFPYNTQCAAFMREIIVQMMNWCCVTPAHWSLFFCNLTPGHACFLSAVIWINTSDPLCVIVQDDVQYGVNLDVTSYTNGKRETHNPPGRALPYSVWDFYEVKKKKLSMQLLDI